MKSAQKKKARDPPAGELTGKEEAASSTETLTYSSFSMARLVQLAFGIYLESLSIQRKSYNYKSRVMELLTTRRKARKGIQT